MQYKGKTSTIDVKGVLYCFTLSYNSTKCRLTVHQYFAMFRYDLSNDKKSSFWRGPKSRIHLKVLWKSDKTRLVTSRRLLDPSLIHLSQVGNEKGTEKLLERTFRKPR